MLQLHDGQAEDIDAGFDQGVTITKGASRSFANIDVASDPAAGQYDYHLGGSGNGAYVRLVSTAPGSTGVGPFTFDVKGDKRGGTYRTSAADIVHEIVSQRPENPPAIVAGDATAMNAASTAVCGLWNGDNLTIRQAIEKILPGVGGKWWTDEQGRFRMGRLTAPSGSPAMNFIRTASTTQGRLSTDAEIVSFDLLPPAVPVLFKVKGNYQPYYTVQTQGLDAAIAAARRVQLQRQWRSVVAEDTGVLTQYPGAAELTIDTQLDVEADAQALVDSILAYWKVRRDLVRVRAQLSPESYALAAMLAETKAYGILDYGDTGRGSRIIGRSLYDAQARAANFLLIG